MKEKSDGTGILAGAVSGTAQSSARSTPRTGTDTTAWHRWSQSAPLDIL